VNRIWTPGLGPGVFAFVDHGFARRQIGAEPEMAPLADVYRIILLRSSQDRMRAVGIGVPAQTGEPIGMSGSFMADEKACALSWAISSPAVSQVSRMRGPGATSCLHGGGDGRGHLGAPSQEEDRIPVLRHAAFAQALRDEGFHCRLPLFDAARSNPGDFGGALRQAVQSA
jgi:hypothetical protein